MLISTGDIIGKAKRVFMRLKIWNTSSVRRKTKIPLYETQDFIKPSFCFRSWKDKIFTKLVD